MARTALPTTGTPDLVDMDLPLVLLTMAMCLLPPIRQLLLTKLRTMHLPTLHLHHATAHRCRLHLQFLPLHMAATVDRFPPLHMVDSVATVDLVAMEGMVLQPGGIQEEDMPHQPTHAPAMLQGTLRATVDHRMCVPLDPMQDTVGSRH